MVTRIFVIATDSAGCYLYRLHWPLTHLPRDQFHIEWRPPNPDELRAGDVVIGQRIAGHNQAWLDMCANPRILTVYEIDDDIIDVDPANTIPYQIFAPQREGTITNIAAADVVTCSTPNLAFKVRNWNPHTVDLPNCLPRYWFEKPDTRRRDGLVTVGWAGSPFHAQDWPGVGEQLAKLAAAQPRVRFRAIGADYMSPHVPVERAIGWCTNSELLTHLDFDIGIAPLSRHWFNESKSWAKLLEYGACGIPAVASARGQYRDWVQFADHTSAAPGWLAQDIGDFADLIGLLCDDDIRARMGAAARARAEQYEISLHAHRWAEVYQRTPRGAR